MRHQRFRTTHWSIPAAGIASALAAMIVYYLTAFRTITWWENPEFSLAAATFGNPHPPGGLIPTILGWMATVLVAPAAKAFALNLLAGLAAAATIVLVYVLVIYLLHHPHSPAIWPGAYENPGAVAAGAALGTLTLAFARTIWQHGTYFSPYIFTALFTILIVTAMIRWWVRADEKGAGWWLFVILLLFGLDFSVHRTNSLLLPAAAVWVLLRRPRTFLSIRAWLSAISGLALGLAVHLLMIPIAASNPVLNAGDTSTFSNFWSYVSLQQYGGGWLFNFLPRKAPFWSVQVMDYLDGFAANFVPVKSGAGVVGVLPVLLGLTGIVGLWRRNRRFAMGLIFLFVMASAGAVIYFNVPNDFFRSMYRHYMPSFVIFAIWMAYGSAMVIIRLMQTAPGWRMAAATVSILLVIIVPVGQLVANYTELDGSRNYFCADYGRNMLNGLPEKAILLTFGDNDTFNLWYLQGVEHLRPDVTVMNYWLLNTPWYVDQLMERDSTLPFPPEAADASQIAPHPMTDTTITIPVPNDPTRFGLAAGATLPDSITVAVTPSIGGKYIMASEWLLLEMVRTGGWRRPICLSIGGGNNIPSSWAPFLQLEGLTQRIIPIPGVPMDRQLLRHNLLDVYAYRGAADPHVHIDDASRMMAFNYLGVFMHLASGYMNAGEMQEGRQVIARMKELIPPERLAPLPPPLQQGLDSFKQPGE